jgi:hypothetical protein
MPTSEWFPPTPEEKTLSRNPFKIQWSRLVIGDIISVSEHRERGTTDNSCLLVLSNRKQKLSYLRIAENIRRDKLYLNSEYLYCTSIMREGKTCFNLLELLSV